MTRVIIEGCGMNLFYDSMEQKRAFEAIRIDSKEKENVLVVVTGIESKKSTKSIFTLTVINVEDDREKFKGDYNRSEQHGELSKLH